MQNWLSYWQLQFVEHWYAWAIFGAYLVAAWFMALVARFVLRGMVVRLTRRRAHSPDPRAVAIAVSPVRWVVLALGLQAALDVLAEKIPGLAQYSAYQWIAKGVTVLVVLASAQMTIALLRSGLNWYMHSLAEESRGTWDRDLLPVVRRVTSMLVYFIALSIILKHFGQDITALVTTAGVASLAVALAAQETVSNMLGGFVILVDRPFKLGDVIELADGKSGEVIEIGLRSTRIRQFDGNALVVPNKDMANTRITNMALPDERAAIRQTISVQFETEVEKAKAILTRIMAAHPDVLQDPAPGAWLTKFNESALELVFSCWVASYRDRFRVTDELNMQILSALREAAIKLPAPPVALQQKR